MWAVSGAEVAQVEAAPLPAEPPLDPRAEPFIPVIESAGASVVEVAVEARRSGDLAHPLNQLARERWLRRCVLDCPGLINALRLRPMAPPTPRRELG